MYTSGRTHAYIERETGVSKAALSGLQKEWTEEDPDLSLVRQLAVWIKDKRTSPESLCRYRIFDEEMEAAGLGVEEATRDILPFVREHREKSTEVARCGVEYHRLVGPRGWSFERLVAERSRLEKECGNLAAKRREEEALEGAVSRRVDEKLDRLGHLEDLEVIDAGLRRVGKGPRDGASVIVRSEELLKMGLTYSVMKAIGEEFVRRGMDKDAAPGAIASLVWEHGSLERACAAEAARSRSLSREGESLSQRVEDCEGELRGLKSSVRAWRKQEDRLKADYARMADRHGRREEAQERELKSRRERTIAWCEAREEETRARCTAMLSDVRSKAARTEEEAGARVGELEVRERHLQESCIVLSQQCQRKAAKISAAETLWNHLLRKHPATILRLKALYEPNESFEGMVLPDPVRLSLVGLAEEILSVDARIRLNAADEKVQRGEKTAKDLVRGAIEAKAKLEARMGRLTLFLQKMQKTELAFDAVMGRTLSEPEFMAVALRRARADYLADAFAKGTPMDRMKYRNALDAADGRVDLALDHQIDAQMKAIYARALSGTVNPVPMFPGFPSYTPRLPGSSPVRTVSGRAAVRKGAASRRGQSRVKGLFQRRTTHEKDIPRP